jgi:hypothetical protein
MAAPPAPPLPQLRVRLLREVTCGSVAAATTACLFNPLELVKTRLQVQHQYPSSTSTPTLLYRGTLHALRTVAAEEGVGALWRHGFVGFVGRDFLYSGLRIGLYPRVRELISLESSGESASLGSKIASGCATGGVGSVIATPMDVVRVRTSVESGLVGRRSPQSPRVFVTGLCRGRQPSFTGGAWGCARLCWREGGARALWRGGVPTCARAAALSGAQLASYDHSKVLLLRAGAFADDGTALHCTCAVVSALVAVTACNPPDVLKSRMMIDGHHHRRAAACHHGGGPSSQSASRCSLASTAAAVWAEAGVRGLYRGWLPAAARAVPAFFIQVSQSG